MPTRNRFAACAILAALLLAPATLSTPAHAAAFPLPDIDILVGADGNLMSVTETMLEAHSTSVVENIDGSVTFSNGSMTMSGVWQWDWNFLTVNTDPVISSSFGFQNISGSTMNYTVSVSLLVPALGPSTVMGGSMGGSVTDSSNDGLGGVSTVAPDALFTGLIDGLGVIPVAELHPDPYSTPAFLFALDTQAIAPVNFGLPGPTAPGPAVFTSIGIKNHFSLSAGDSVAMTNAFIVEEVPEPASIVLALLAAVGLAGIAWRRRGRS